MWQAMKSRNEGCLEYSRKKVVGEPYEGKPHVRFEVAGDGNQDMVWVIEALSKETESKQAAPPKSQAPSLDPTTRLVGFAAVKRDTLRSSHFRRIGLISSCPPAGNANR